MRNVNREWILKKEVNVLQGAPATAPEISVICVTDFLLSQGTFASLLQKDTGGYWHIPGVKAKHAIRNQVAVLFSPMPAHAASCLLFSCNIQMLF